MASFYETVRDQVNAIKETIADLIVDSKIFILEAWPLLLVIFMIGIVALWVSDPIPPRHVTMAVGPKGSADDLIASKYQKYFEEHGIVLEIKNTNGSVTNYTDLIDPKSPVQAAFVLAGVADKDNKDILTLGSINYEPLWCFYRGTENFFTRTGTGLEAMMSKRVNIGPIGSGTFNQISSILKLLKIDITKTNFTNYPSSQAADMLINGKLDSVCIVDSLDSPTVVKLLSQKDLHLSYNARAEAYAKKIHSIEVVDVPRSSLDLEMGIPAENMKLLASTREILVDKDLHPAIQTLFLMAATRINGGETFFSKEGEFPAFKDNNVQRSSEAETYYTKGEPYMVSWLPFWMSEFARRLFLTLLPLAAIAYPIIRSTPNYYKNRVRGKINKLYGEIKFFEQQLVDNYEPSKLNEYLGRLRTIEADALKMKVPKSISQDYFTMRSSIEFVANRLVNGIYQKEQEAEPSPQLEFDFNSDKEV